MANLVEMPKLGFDMAEGTLIRWVKSENEKVEKGEVLAEIETDKATVEVESTFSGLVHKHLVEENAVVPVGTPIAVIAQEGEEVNLEEMDLQTPPSQAKSAVEPESDASEHGEEALDEEVDAEEQSGQDDSLDDALIKASPIAKIIASEKGIDLSTIKGTGPGGRIVRRDVESAAAPEKTPEKQPAQKKMVETRKIEPGKDESITISRLRAAIGKRMLESRQNIPHFYITRSYDVEQLMQMRQEMNDDLPEEDRLSVNDFVLRAVALALRDFPNLNASLTGNQLTRYGNIHLGVAVAVENGLLTVVVRNADQKNLPQIAAEMKGMLQRVKDGKPKPEDLEGSTFTISNLGMFKVDDFVAIINPPEAAILAVSSALQVPVILQGQLGVGWRMKATISADHRITDGAEAARFMARLADFLEQPWRLI